MNDDRFERRGDRPGELTRDDQRRLLELELIKIQSEAAAARLDARAAEIEWMIRQLAVDKPGTAPSSTTNAAETPIDPPHFATSAGVTPAAGSAPASLRPSLCRFESWDDVRSAASRMLASAMPPTTVSPPASETTAVPAAADKPVVTRVDSGEATVKAPHFIDVGDAGSNASVACEEEIDTPDGVADAGSGSIAVSDTRSAPESPLVTDDSLQRVDTIKAQVVIDAAFEEKEEDQRRGKPAWLVSAIAHVAVLVILAAVSFQTQRPKDQVALTASAAEANEVSMETFAIESDEPEPEVSEPTPSETRYELSPAGQITATDFAPDAPPAPPSPVVSAMGSSTLSSAAAMSLQSDSTAKIQFCGVEGGGNHFVYLVDSSGSMGDGFESARAELLASIAALKPEQRFYVVFFDAKSDYMRLSSADKDEPSSVYATTENKAALKRWAMRIAMDRGRAPYDALRFALELKPDVIFLLSDGEFPQGIEDLLKEENKVENLFGDSHPISIVHTISYHSQEGESRMRRIAQQNKGQYRYIPKP